MIENAITIKMYGELIRLKTEEFSSNKCCSVPMLLKALFAIRGSDEIEYTNLFHVYFEEIKGIKQEAIDDALDGLIHQEGEDEKGEDGTFATNILSEGISDKMRELMMSKELLEVFKTVEQFAKENQKEVILPEYFIISLFKSGSKSLRAFLKKIHVNYMEAEYFFGSERLLGYEIVPYRVSSFIQNVTKETFGGKCDIMGREDIIKKMFRIVLKSSKRNLVLYGAPGVGKTAIGDKFAYKIVNKDCPEPLKECKVFYMSIKNFVLSIKDEKDASQKIDFLMNYLSKSKDEIILIIDEIQTILGKVSLFNLNQMDLSPILKEVLVGDKVRIIGITTSEDYGRSFESDAALSRRFEGVLVEEPKMMQIFKMIRPTIKTIEERYGVSISEELIDSAAWYAACFEWKKSNPDKIIDVISRAMANSLLDGRNYVILDDLLQVFEIVFKKWNACTYEDKHRIAVHEMGHYLVGRLASNDDTLTLAVSIYPTDDYNGVNVYEYVDEAMPNTTRKYFMNEIASSLGGRIAEQIKFGEEETNQGASADLLNANAIAEEMVSEFGLRKKGSNRIYDPDDILFSNEKRSKELDQEVEEILGEATRFTKKLIIENMDYLDALVKAILDKPILKAEELNGIWDKVTEERKNRPQVEETKPSTPKVNTPKYPPEIKFQPRNGSSRGKKNRSKNKH